MTINWRTIVVVCYLVVAYLVAGTSDFHSMQGLAWP